MMPNVLERLGAYVHYMGWRRGLGLVAHRQLGKLLNPGVDLIWGSLGEDALLWFYLTEVLSIRKPGFYVDVGCNHPVYHSNTWRLYQLGWCGIAIDANHEITEVYKKVRPRDQVVTMLVSDMEREMEFVVFEGSLVSTVESQHAAAWEKSIKIQEVSAPRGAGSLVAESATEKGPTQPISYRVLSRLPVTAGVKRRQGCGRP